MFESTDSYSILGSLVKGGWVMVPLLLCSLTSLALVIERFVWGPTRARVMPVALRTEAQKLISSGRIDELVGLCRANKSPLARVLLAALKNGPRPRQQIVEAVEVIGRKEAFQIQRYVGVLGTIAAVSPLLGLLGTVSGMIRTFNVISQHGIGSAPLLAGGIAEALITTATGLMVAVPSLLFYRYFLYQSRQLVVEMEVLSLSLIDELLNQSGTDEGGASVGARVPSAANN